MNLRISTRVRICIKETMKALIAAIFFAMTLLPAANADWVVDLSRRTKELNKKEYSVPTQAKEKESLFEYLFDSGEPIQEIVILNTEKGFVPASVRVREGLQYKIHVVNVNENDRNVSFVLDSFSEHHATYYGKIRTFMIKPKKEGVYTFQSPETSAQGRLVVYPPFKPSEVSDMRAPASE